MESISRAGRPAKTGVERRNAAISFAGIAGRIARRSVARRRARACLPCRAIAAIVLAGIATPERSGDLIHFFVRRRWQPVSLLLLLAVLLGPLGCSLSDSSKSSSDSAKSSSDSSKSSSDSSASSSASSSPGDTAYFDDVRTTTEAYAKSGGPFDAYQKKLGDLARDRGVTNWEENLGTYVAIGEGLGSAKASSGLVETFKDRLAPPGSVNSPDKRSAIQKGYESRKRPG